jgi:DnaJ like chaperone protein
MNWWGKIIGGSFGFILGGPLGALLGAAIGHNFDKGLKRVSDDFSPGAQARVQTVFFTATFSVMGHLAKADGRVSPDEIEVARQVMLQMQLDPEQQRVARALFSEGKQDDFELDAVLAQFRRECQRRHNLMQMFIEIQLHAAYADGVVHAKERRLLSYLCGQLGFSVQEFAHLEAMVQAQHHMGGGGQAGGRRAASGHSGLSLDDAYAVLDISATATDAEAKKAYRRLMSQHHPDKLVSKGLPEEMMALAKEKTQEIRAAYDLIKESRNLK